MVSKVWVFVLQQRAAHNFPILRRARSRSSRETKMERRRIHATRRDAEQSARCARAVRPLRRSKRQRESNEGAARSEAAPARLAFSASDRAMKMLKNSQPPRVTGQLFDVQMVSSCDSKSAEAWTVYLGTAREAARLRPHSVVPIKKFCSGGSGDVTL